MYRGPESDEEYIKYWSQYEDDKEEAPDWIDQFRSDDQHQMVRYELPPINENEEENDQELDFTPYKSPERKIVPRAPSIKTFNPSKLNERAIAIFRENEQHLLSLPTLRSQIIETTDLLRPKNESPLASFSQISTIFNIQKGTLCSHYSRGIEENDTGRPPVLSDDEINEIISFVYEKYFSHEPATYESILYFLKERFDKDVIIKTLYGQLSRVPQLKCLDGVPMESDRVNCSIQAIEQYYNDLESILSKQTIPSAFVINIDEAGFAEWQDSMCHSVIVPSCVNEDEVKLPVNRQGKRASLLAGICADGSTVIPAIVVPRKTVETELYESGYTRDKVCILYSESGFFSTELFDKWAFNYFFPEMLRKRETYDYQGEILLILDGFGAHDSDDFLTACTENGIIPLFLAPHSSDQTQPLDIGIFGVQKSKMGRMQVPSGLSEQSAQLIKILDSFHQTATISNIISAFNGAGIVSKYHPEHGLIPRVVRAQAIKVRHWVNVQQNVFNKKRIHL